MSNVRDFDLMTVGVKHVIPQRILHERIGGRWEIQTYLDHVTDNMIVSLVGYLAADQLKVVRITHPLDWWEAVKERWAPSWALRRWPVRHREHVVDLKAVYPDYVIPKLGRSIRIVTLTENANEE